MNGFLTHQIIEKNSKDFFSGKIPPSQYGKHIIDSAPIPDIITKTTKNADMLLKKIKLK